MQEANEQDADHEARCNHIYNTTYAWCQLFNDEDELGAILSAAAHAYQHFHSIFTPHSFEIDVNQEEEAPETPAIITAVK